MPCTYTFDGQTFNTKDELDAYIAANREAITAKYASNLQNQIIGAKGAQSNRELSRSLNAARELESKNSNKEQIFRITGWERGADGKWRTKLPTDNIEILHDPIQLIEDVKKMGAKAHVGDVIHYPELYAIYPSIRFIEIDMLPETSKANGTMSATSRGKVFIKLHSRLRGNKKQAQETLIHELQHVVQALEDFNYSPAKNENFSDYFNSYSEVEARAAARMSFVKDLKKDGVIIGKYEDVAEEDKLPSHLFSKDFTGTVVFNKDQDFVVALKQKGATVNPLDSNELVVEGLGGIKITNFQGIYNLQDIRTFDKGKGNGTKLLKFVTDIADQLGVPLKLHAIDYNRQEGLSKKELVEFYERNGFKIVPGQYDFDSIAKIKKYIFSKIGDKEGVDMVRQPQGQILNQEAKGAFDTMQRVIYAVTDPNVSTPLHELAHAWEISLTEAERQEILDWANHTEWTRETSEQFARGFEQYMLEGKSKDSQLQTLFDKFAAWLKDVYDKVVIGLGLQLNDQMVDIYDRMLGIKAEVASQKFTLPTIEQILEQPNPRPNEPDFGRTSSIQNALAERYYDNKIANGTMEVANLRQVLKSNGLSELAADTVMFRVNNPDIVVLIDKDIPKDKYNKPYLQAAKKAFKEGLLDQAAINKVIKWDKYYQILDYIGEATPKTNEAKVGEFVRKFYMAAEVQPVEEPVVEQAPVEEVTPEQPAPEVVAPIEEPVAQTTEPEADTEAIQTGDYVVYEGASYKELKGKPIEVVGTHETDANITDGFVRLKFVDQEIPLFTLRKATAEEVQTVQQPLSTEQPLVTDSPDKFGKDDKVTFQGEEYTVNYAFKGVALDDRGKEVETTLYNISKGPKEFNVKVTDITAAKPSVQKQIIKNHVLTLISNRFQQIFPQIETEIGAFDFEAPARFYNGRVQLNTNYQGVGLFKEGIAHEYMHPVVAALKISNKYLYDNLVAELNATQKEILAEVQAKIDKGLYTEADKTDEALVTFLGREISKAFDEEGIPRDYTSPETIAARKELAELDAKRANGEEVDQDYYDATRKQAEQPSFIEGKRRTLIQRFLQWWTDIMNFILGKMLVKDINTFVKGVNKKTDMFEFHARDNEDYGIEFTKEVDKVQVYIDKTMFPNLTSIEIMRQYASRMSPLFEDNAEFEKYEKEFNTLLDENRLTFDPKPNQVKQRQKFNISSLHPRMGLNGMVTLMQANLGKDAITPIQYNETELGVIQQLEAYLKLDEEQEAILKQKREQIVKKIKALADIATSRIGEGTRFVKLKEDAERLSKLNVFTESDAEFIAEYIKHGADSINTAWRMFNNLREELADKTNLDSVRLNRINKEIEQIKQLVGMYDNVRDLYNHYNESFDTDQLSNFERATINLERVKSQMKSMMAELATEQIMPTIERNNKSLEAQGYKKYVLKREDVKKLLLNGSTKDIGWFAHMLGAPVNSTDTINAAVANSIADALNYVYSNNLEAINGLVDAYKNFDQRKLSEKEQEKWFKDNYLRKAKFWDIISRDDTGKPTFGYVEKYAFHQDKLYDLFEDDLRLFKESLPIAMKIEDDWANQARVDAWVAANKDSQRYVNPKFQQLKSDKYYQELYKNYTTSNNKYGENRLAYGIIPQFFDETIIEKFKNKWSEVSKVFEKDKTTKERFTKLGDEIFGEQLGDKDKRGINLDGTVYRSVNSETTTFKDDSKLNYNLQEVMVDFISDAGNYEAKREVQFNMENIKQLIGGNSFFGIGERTIGTRDFATEFRQQRAAKEKLKKIETEIKNGKTLNATEQAEYEKLKEQAAGNVFKQVYDNFLGRPIKARTARANRQAVEFINDVFYNEDEFESHVKVGGRTFDLNKAGGKLGYVQAIVNMSGNVVAATNNVLAGNMSMFIESMGAKHFTFKDLALAHAQYAAATPGFFADMKNPIKSEVTQYGLLFDAIQGEFTNNLGEKITGNLMKKFVNPSSFFLLTHAGEHQIQLTGMLALMNATKVKTTSGETISLKQAFAKDQNGRYKLRSDVKWSKEDKQQFVRTLHGISRTLNGNYNNLHKGHLQRYWFGKLAMQYRKYIYPAVVARYGQERVDLEKGTVEMGYLRYFLGSFLFQALRDAIFKQTNRYKTLTPDQKYWSRKAIAELSAYALLTIAALAMGSGDPDKIKEMSQAEKALLFYTIRVHNELGMYHLDSVTEAFKQAQHPIASMRLISALGKTLVQLYHPTETYEQDGNGYKAGDLKLTSKFKKVIPKFITYPADRFQIDWDNYLSYQSLIQQMPR